MWESKWAAFAKVEGLSDALVDALDPIIPNSSVAMTGKDAAGKQQAAAVKTNKKINSLLSIGV